MIIKTLIQFNIRINKKKTINNNKNINRNNTINKKKYELQIRNGILWTIKNNVAIMFQKKSNNRLNVKIGRIIVSNAQIDKMEDSD